MHKLWVIKKQDKALQQKLAKELDISPVLAQILINRGLATANDIEKFLSCEKSALHNPFMLKDIRKAVDRIRQAIRDKEKILICGDYDVDGITGVAILFTLLRDEGAVVNWHIPNRLDEGYGLSMKAVNLAKAGGVGLLITVDCGTTDKEEVALLNRYGIDSIIIDHHQIQKANIPDAFCLINPLQEDCDYPFKDLSGAGLAYKVACALLEDIEHSSEEFLDLVALGTVADIAPQLGENRILTSLGMKRLGSTNRIGLKTLMQVAGLNKKVLKTEDIGFIIGPRINAGGRIGAAELALRLILSQDKDESTEIAGILNQENSFRQRLQEGIFKEAVSKIEGRTNFKDHRVIVVWGEDWHPGVIGIVASKIVDRFYRPAIVLSVQENRAKGSGRSIDNFHLFDAVSRCKGLLENFGGHEAACGITMPTDNIEKFRDSINRVASEMITAADLVPKIEVDMELPLSDINSRLMEELEMLEPFGAGNPQPLFLSTNLKVKAPPVSFGRSGVKMWVTDKKITCEAACFNASGILGRAQDLGAVDLVYYPKVREISGVSTLKLEIEDLKIGYKEELAECKI